MQMHDPTPSRSLPSLHRFGPALLAALFLLLAACGGGDSPEPAAPAGPESFTFFDIGRHSRFTDSLRRDLQQKLGDDAVERRSIIDLEVRLMYRYARQRNAPFDLVELVFDGRFRSPLVFRFRFKADETGLIAALQDKHGPPQVIAWDRENGQSLIWRRHADVLMASLVPDAFGGVNHQVAIYFTENLNRWVEFEQTQKARKSGDGAAGRTAF